MLTKFACSIIKAAVIIVFLLPQGAKTQPVDEIGRLQGSYYCVGEFSGGISFDENAKRWRGTSFKPEEKFILRLKFVRQRTVKNYLGKDERVSDYRVSMSPAGTNISDPCVPSGDRSQELVALNQYESFQCSAILHDYLFNLINNRFISIYPVGYVQGGDNNKNTPAITGGTCTKID